jgi:hypothetical protein
MFLSKMSFKNSRNAHKVLRAFSLYRGAESFTRCHPCKRKHHSLACWVVCAPHTQRYHVAFRSNRLNVCDVTECDLFDNFVKNRRDLWKGQFKDGNIDKRIDLMSQMAQKMMPLSSGIHPAGNIDGLMKKLFA